MDSTFHDVVVRLVLWLLRCFSSLVEFNQIQDQILGCLNVCFVVNKSAETHSIIADHNLDLLAVTETWIMSDAPPAVKADIAPSGYAILHVHRESEQGGPKRGGGLAVIHRDRTVW